MFNKIKEINEWFNDSEESRDDKDIKANIYVTLYMAMLILGTLFFIAGVAFFPDVLLVIIIVSIIAILICHFVNLFIGFKHSFSKWKIKEEKVRRESNEK